MRPAFLMIALTACGSATGPTISILKNDGFVSGAPAFQAGFSAGEGAAVVLGPETSAFAVRSVEFLFGGSDTAKTITLAIWVDLGHDTPGSELYSHDYLVTPSNSAFRQIDLTAQNITVASGQKIRVAIFVQHTGLPGVAKDGDGNTPTRNYVYSSSTWSPFESLGGDGDYIIRATIEH